MTPTTSINARTIPTENSDFTIVLLCMNFQIELICYVFVRIHCIRFPSNVQLKNIFIAANISCVRRGVSLLGDINLRKIAHEGTTPNIAHGFIYSKK